MRFLEKLLDGAEVAWVPLGEVTQYVQPTKYLVRTKNYNDDFKTPVLTAGKHLFLGIQTRLMGLMKHRTALLLSLMISPPRTSGLILISKLSHLQ